MKILFEAIKHVKYVKIEHQLHMLVKTVKNYARFVMRILIKQLLRPQSGLKTLIYENSNLCKMN